MMTHVGVEPAGVMPGNVVFMETLSIRMFGPLEITVGAQRLPQFATRKSRSLFSYLVLHRDRAHSRDVLAGTFWGEYPDAIARKHLRDALWRIRQVLASAKRHGLQLEIEGQAVGVDMGHRSWLDIREFETGVSRLEGRTPEEMTPEEADLLRSAVDLYRADLLAEVYDDWCVYERERLRILALEALQRLMTFHVRRHEWAAALRGGQRLLTADPLQEPVHRALMRCYAGMGNRAAAVRQYQTCAKLLRDELAVQPTADTVALYHEIRQADPSAVADAPPPEGDSRAAALLEVSRHLKRVDRGLRRTRRELRAGTEAVRRALE